jgi:hypothetical protein
MYAFLEDRVLLDLESFHVGLRQQPNDMIILSKSRMKTFGLWNEAQKNRPAILREEASRAIFKAVLPSKL